MKKQELKQMEKQVNDLHTSLQRLTTSNPIVEMIKIIHQPGYTTVAEHALITVILESMIAHTASLATLKQALLGAAGKVSLNPQPLPPGPPDLGGLINPQPLPPGRSKQKATPGLNPQPLPPGKGKKPKA